MWLIFEKTACPTLNNSSQINIENYRNIIKFCLNMQIKKERNVYVTPIFYEKDNQKLRNNYRP